MKIRTFLPIFCLFVALAWPHFAGAQTVLPLLKAILHNGRVTLQVNSQSATDSLFVRDSSSKIALDFYFTPTDVRNGFYTAQPNQQVQGDVYLSFQTLPWQTSDALTFTVAQYGPDGGVVRAYTFADGDYLGPDGPPPSACPISITCDVTGLVLTYNPLQDSVLKAVQRSISLFFGTGHALNGVYAISKIDKWNNSFYIQGNFDCNQVATGTIVVVFEGLACQFAGGQPVGAPTCSIFSSYYTPGDICAEYLENCGSTLLSILVEKNAEFPCRQWKEEQIAGCGTHTYLYRPGKVSIGTSGQAPNSSAGGKAALSVKNGVITDKVKVKLCDANWCDYVFDPGYMLRSLPETEAYIQQNCHLPGMPSGEVIEAEGAFELGETTRLQQEKIEEIFLHLLRLETEVAAAEGQLAWLQWREKQRTK